MTANPTIVSARRAPTTAKMIVSTISPPRRVKAGSSAPVSETGFPSATAATDTIVAAWPTSPSTTAIATTTTRANTCPLPSLAPVMPPRGYTSSANTLL